MANKYGLSGLLNDKYSYDAQYSNELAGIGQTSSTSKHVNARGTGMIRVNGATSLDNNDFLLWSHDGSDFSTTEVVDVPFGINNRMKRVWRFDETGTVGTVNVQVDMSSMPMQNASDVQLLIDANDDGIFNDILTEQLVGTYSEPILTFTGVTPGDHRFTLGSTTNGTVLPVTWGKVKVDAQKFSNLITWEIYSEQNNRYFSIERSIDGKTYDIIGKVKGRGNSTVYKEYTFEDKLPLSGIAYYRITQVDFDGAEESSVVISTQRLSLNEVKIRPNPSNKGVLNVSLESIAHQLNIQLINSLGQLVYQNDFEEVQTIELNLSYLTNGIYTVVMTENGHRIVKRWIINK